MGGIAAMPHLASSNSSEREFEGSQSDDSDALRQLDVSEVTAVLSSSNDIVHALMGFEDDDPFRALGGGGDDDDAFDIFGGGSGINDSLDSTATTVLDGVAVGEPDRWSPGLGLPAALPGLPSLPGIPAFGAAPPSRARKSPAAGGGRRRRRRPR